MEFGKRISDSVLKNQRSVIWHISDMHFSSRKRFTAGNHCNHLLDKFFSVLAERENISDDLFIITGDCTTTGSALDFAKFDNFLRELEDLGVDSTKVLVVPGNHDAWTGIFRLIVWFFVLIPKKILIYLKRVTLFSHFELFSKFFSGSHRLEHRTVNGKDICFCLVNSCVRSELSRGVFPESLELKTLFGDDQDESLKVIVLHHHVTDLARDELGIADSYVSKIKESKMKIVNSAHLQRQLDSGYGHVVMHGHQHLQYFSKNSPYVIAAPSLLESKYCKKTHSDSIKNMIGFNVLIPTEETFDLLFYRYKDGEFRLNDVFCKVIHEKDVSYKRAKNSDSYGVKVK